MDTADIIVPSLMFPEVGMEDIVLFNEFGAYSYVTASTFNGFRLPYFVYYLSKPAQSYLKKLKRWPSVKEYLDKQRFVYYEE